MSRKVKFTIYDAMQEKGVFDTNPANAFSRDPTDGHTLYKGPVQYPKMLYHPKGEQRITVPGTVEVDKAGGRMIVGEQRELIYMTVENEAEEKAAVAKGWHVQAAGAIRARVNQIISSNPNISDEEKELLLASVPMIQADRVKELEAEIAKLQSEKAKPVAGAVAKPATATATAA